MSAGICIMNKNAIALAADSAVTVGRHLAIHNSANKLFALSKVAPVGVIVYSNAEFMNIPIEIILKQYKSGLMNQRFPSLQGYVDDFLQFLILQSDLFHFKINEGNYIRNVYVDLLNGLNGDYQNLIKKNIASKKRDLSPEEMAEIQHEAVDATVIFVNSFQDIPNFSVSDYVKDNYCAEIKSYIKSRFTWIDNEDLEKLANITCTVYNKNFMRSGYVGLAFAGYGENDIFPRMVHLHISGVLNNIIRYIKIEDVSISEKTPATITPLAQTDVMQTFLYGTNDSFINDIDQEVPRQIQNCLLTMDDSFFAPGKKEVVQQELNKTTSNIIQQIIQNAQKKYLFPITQSVATLPIEELALLAESMINITSLRRKVALDDNIGTVGGPIDVSIISKSDGFIWLKRKHYFDQKYNPQYFYSHYNLLERDEQYGKGDES